MSQKPDKSKSSDNLPSGQSSAGGSASNPNQGTSGSRSSGTSNSKTSQSSSKNDAGSSASGTSKSTNQASSKTSVGSRKSSTRCGTSTDKSQCRQGSSHTLKGSSSKATSGGGGGGGGHSATNNKSGHSASGQASNKQTDQQKIFENDPKMLALFKHKKYQVIKQLGKGSYGQVYLAYKEETNENVAIKVMLLAQLPPRYKQSCLPYELIALMYIRHDNVVRTLEIIRANEMLFVTMELCPNGDLRDYIKMHQVAEPLAKYWFTQMVTAMAFMHKQHRMAHRDIKLDNVLLDANYDTKLADFGLAKPCWDKARHCTTLSQSACGTMSYMAPQILLLVIGQPSKYNPFLADAWAMGVLLFALLHRELPFAEAADVFKAHPTYIKSRFNANLSKELIDLGIRLMDPKETTRITMHETLKHEWMLNPVTREAAFANTTHKQ